MNDNMKKDKTYYKQLEVMARGFYNLAFREGPIENYHETGCPIGNKEMEKINRFGFNRLGYLLDLLLSGEEEKVLNLCKHGALAVDYFDPIDYNSAEVREMEEVCDMLGL